MRNRISLLQSRYNISNIGGYSNIGKMHKEISKTQKEIGIADICNLLGINKNAASRVLDSLLEYNWIYLSDSVQKKYRFTLKPFSVVAKCTPQYALAEIARPDLQRLNEQLGDAVYLGIKNNNNVLYLLHFDSSKEVRINGRVGGEYPLNTSAPGKVLLAYGEHSKKFENESALIKSCGYAIDNEEFAKGIICIACPIFDEAGKIVAAAGISSLTIYDDINTLVIDKLSLLKETARNISLNLGYKII